MNIIEIYEKFPTENDCLAFWSILNGMISLSALIVNRTKLPTCQKNSVIIVILAIRVLALPLEQCSIIQNYPFKNGF